MVPIRVDTGGFDHKTVAVTEFFIIKVGHMNPVKMSNAQKLAES